MTRSIVLGSLALLGFVACRAAEPLREFSAREDRLRILDSLARGHPCTTVRATVLFDATAWTPAHACAVAARAMQLLAVAKVHEPYMAPGDTARVSVMRVSRQRWCQLSVLPDADPPGRMDSLSYLVDIEVPDRPHYLGAMINAQTLAGEVAFDAHPRGIWSGSRHLVPPTEAPDTLEAGAACGLS